MSKIDEIAREWIEGASKAGDDEAVAVAELALAGDEDARREVLEMERQAMLSLEEWTSTVRRDRWDEASDEAGA